MDQKYGYVGLISKQYLRPVYRNEAYCLCQYFLNINFVLLSV